MKRRASLCKMSAVVGILAVPALTQEFFAPALIDPRDQPMTHSQADIKNLPSDQVEVGDRTLPCEVRQIRLADEVPQWGDNLQATLWLCSQLPGGVARVELRAVEHGRPYEFQGRVAEYRIVP